MTKMSKTIVELIHLDLISYWRISDPNGTILAGTSINFRNPTTAFRSAQRMCKRFKNAEIVIKDLRG